MTAQERNAFVLNSLRQSTKRKGYKRSAVDFKRLLRSEQTAGFLGGGAFCRPKSKVLRKYFVLYWRKSNPNYSNIIR